MKKWRIVFLILIFPMISISDYRAYELRITQKIGAGERTVLSTLDNLQYPTYYPLNAEESIEYMDSWMCWGNSSGLQPICPRPEGREPATPKTNSL